MITVSEQPDNRSHGPAVLIVDDEEAQRLRMESICEAINADSAIQVQTASNLTEAFSALATRSFHVILLDKNLASDSQNGISAIADMLHMQPNIQILMISGDDGVNDVAAAMRAGAFWYVSKRNDDSLIQLQIEKALQFAKLMLDQKRVEHNAFINAHGVTLAGSSEVTKRLLRQLIAISQSDAPVVLLGERLGVIKGVFGSAPLKTEQSLYDDWEQSPPIPAQSIPNPGPGGRAGPPCTGQIPPSRPNQPRIRAQVAGASAPIIIYEIKAIEYARVGKIPYLGICIGLQLAIIEYARISGIKGVFGSATP